MDCEKNLLRDAGIKVLKDRGSAEILEEDEQGIFVKDTWSIAYILVCEDTARGIEWLEKHKYRGYELLMLYGRDLADYAVDNLGLTMDMVCHQLVWTKPEPPKRTENLVFATAAEKDIPFIKENYHAWDDDWCMELIDRGNIQIPWLDEETPIGFIGEHLEGALGLLFVRPEYRNRGFALEMEAFMIKHVMDKGILPYGHVVLGNEKSLFLQQKIGFDTWDGEVYWLFKQ